MIGRKYIIVIVLSWLCILSLGLVLAFDTTRMSRAEEEHTRYLIEMGASLYADNCTQCHGVQGQGFVGAPLNLPDLQGNPVEGGDVYRELYNAIANGRPGTTVPKWQAVPHPEDEESWLWASYTAMPAWHQSNDGPLNEMQVRALTYFIMSGEWDLVVQPQPRYVEDENGNIDFNATIAALPPGEGLDPEESLLARETFTFACMSCHAIGGLGNTVGPDLSHVGSWAVGIRPETWSDFLFNWIYDPMSVPNRAPVFWSNYGGPILEPIHVDWWVDEGGSDGGAANAEGIGTEGSDTLSTSAPRSGGAEWGIEMPDVTPLPPSHMSAFGGSYPDEVLQTLVDYLMSLR